MTGSVFMGLVVVLAVIFYLLSRRRGTRQNEAMKPLRAAEQPKAAMEAPDLKPFRPKAGGVNGGIPPRPSAHDSGSSHPAYPVAPAKYAGAVPLKPGASGRYPVQTGGTVSRPELDPVAEARKAANAPTPTEPWYPEAPASYAEGDGPADGLREPGADRPGRRG